MIDSFTKITGLEWHSFCSLDPSQWLELKGLTINDSEYGQGTISDVRIRKNASPIVKISFKSPQLHTQFNGESFQDSAVSLWIPNSKAHIIRQKVQEQLARDKAERRRQEQIVEEFIGISLWHITHISNITSVLKLGLLSNSRVQSANIQHHDISEPSVQSWRDHPETVYKQSIHSYVPLYINPRNPMLSRRRKIQDELCIVEVSTSVILNYQCVISDGNAAAGATKFFEPMVGLNELDWDLLRKGSWFGEKEKKRKMCAEVLVPDSIPLEYFLSIRCYAERFFPDIQTPDMRVIASPKLYF